MAIHDQEIDGATVFQEAIGFADGECVDAPRREGLADL
jgi:hypothetical protein